MDTIQREAGPRVKPSGPAPAARPDDRFPSGPVPSSVRPMKVRLSDATVRFRLSPAEIADWLAKGSCAGGVRVGPREADQWSYQLDLVHRDGWQVRSDDGRLVVEVPMALAQAWDASGGMPLDHTTAWGTCLRIERDLARRGSRDRDKDRP